MDASDLDYELPPEAIAQTPLSVRDQARLFVDRGPDQQPDHRRIADLADLLRPGDLLVVNDSRVLPARLALHRPGGGRAEVLLLEHRAGCRWEALARPSRKLAPGTRLTGDSVTVVTVEDLGEGRWLVDVEGDIEGHGEVPLPPYIHEPLAEPERYQTIYARRPVSAAAPTAGLHLTHAVLERCRERGIGLATVELAIGLDTFRPVTTDTVEAHVMHSEAYTVTEEVLDACRAAERVVAVGTTVVRTLESVARRGELSGRTDLFITPGFDFQTVDVLLTNFHLPRTSLLALLAAFVGPRWRDLYEIALKEQYRFLSFGDAMLVERAR